MTAPTCPRCQEPLTDSEIRALMTKRWPRRKKPLVGRKGRSGRKPVPTCCPRCGERCASWTAAQRHCHRNMK